MLPLLISPYMDPVLLVDIDIKLFGVREKIIKVYESSSKVI